MTWAWNSAFCRWWKCPPLKLNSWKPIPNHSKPVFLGSSLHVSHRPCWFWWLLVFPVVIFLPCSTQYRPPRPAGILICFFPGPTAFEIIPWQFFVTFLGWWSVTLSEGCWWPPTFGDKKVTSWITWSVYFPFPCLHFFAKPLVEWCQRGSKHSRATNDIFWSNPPPMHWIYEILSGDHHPGCIKPCK